MRYLIAFVFMILPAGEVFSEVHIATWAGNAPAAYSLTYDDSYHPEHEMMGNALTDRGLWGTFFVNPGLCWNSPGFGWDKPAKEAFIKLAADGHELGSHTMMHEALTYGEDRDYAFESEEAFRQDCVEIKAILDQYNQKSTQSIGYPFGQNHEASRAVAAEYFLSGRVSGCDRVNCPSPHMFWLTTWQCRTVTPLETLNERVFLTIESGGWGIEQYHTLDENLELTAEAYLSHMDVVAEQAATNQIWNATVGDVSRYIYSRDAALVKVVRETNESLELIVDDRLDDQLYDVPLTILAEVPQMWASAGEVVMSRGGETSHVDLVEENGKTYAMFDAIANEEPLLLYAKPVSFLLESDLDHDGFVGAADLNILRAHWGEEADPEHGDVSDDGVVGYADLDIVRSNWGRGSLPTSVPEPSALLLLFGSLIGLQLFRNRTGV